MGSTPTPGTSFSLNDKRYGSRYSGALTSPFDLRLTVGHAEAHAQHAGMFLEAVRQRLRMRGSPELGHTYLQGIQRQADFLSDRFVSFASLRRRASGFAQRIQAAVAALALGSS